MRQTLCDGYLVIFALAQAVILLMLTPLFTGISRQIRARMLKRAKLFKIDMEFFQDKPEARIWKLFKIKQRH